MSAGPASPNAFSSGSFYMYFSPTIWFADGGFLRFDQCPGVVTAMTLVCTLQILTGLLAGVETLHTLIDIW